MGLLVLVILTIDRVTAALGAIGRRLGPSQFRIWEINRAEKLLSKRDRNVAVDKLAAHVEAILAAVSSNGGQSMSDKVDRALCYAEHAGEAIDALHQKLDRVIEHQDDMDEKLAETIEKVRLME
jgi:hypothetical protein